jgi:hypothetical protein
MAFISRKIMLTSRTRYEVLDDDDIEKDDVTDLANEDDDYELV